MDRQVRIRSSYWLYAVVFVWLDIYGIPLIHPFLFHHVSV